MNNLEQQKMDALAEFAAGAGHEINNPLAIIGGRTQLLLGEIEHPEHRRQLGVIVAQVKRAYEMIADIRFFARPPQPEPVTFNLPEELQMLAREQTPLMSESGIAFHVEIDTAADLMVHTDPVLIHAAATVLCNNAREAVQLTKGNVGLRLYRKEDVWEIVVQDDGSGISEEIRPLIFDPYYSGRQAGRGLGFGLPKAWRIMQLLGGSIRHEQPDAGQGAKFILTLPADQASGLVCKSSEGIGDKK